MSGKEEKGIPEQRLGELAKLFVIDTSNPATGIKISLPAPAPAPATTPAPATRAPDTAIPHSPPPTLPPSPVSPSPSPSPSPYEVRVSHGRIIRESRHADSEHADWAHAIGPSYADLEKKATSAKRESAGAPLNLVDLEYVVVDTETTGGALTHGHRITEIAIVRVNANGKVLHEYSTLVNPGRSIPYAITALTHIDNQMVRTAPRFEDIAEDVRALLNGRVFVAHNAPFDWGFVSGELVRTTGRPLGGRKLCTVRLARKVVPEIRRRSLDSLSYFFNVPNEARHRAYGDARATAIIFRKMMDRVFERDIETWQQLEHMTLRRSQRKKRTAMPTPMEDV